MLAVVIEIKGPDGHMRGEIENGFAQVTLSFIVHFLRIYNDGY